MESPKKVSWLQTTREYARTRRYLLLGIHPALSERAGLNWVFPATLACAVLVASAASIAAARGDSAGASETRAYAEGIRVSLCDAFQGPPERIFWGFSWLKGARIVLLDDETQVAFEIDEGSLCSGLRALDYDSLPLFFRQSLMSMIHRPGADVFKFNISATHRKLFDRNGGPFAKNRLYQVLFHEGFHLLHQHQRWAGKELQSLAMAQTVQFPIDWKPYYLRFELTRALMNHYDRGIGLGAAAHWHRRFVREYPKQYRSPLRRLDRKEGMAKYADTVATLMREYGPDFPESDIRELVLKHKYLVPELILLTPLSISSYMAGGYAGLILRKERGRAWERKVATREVSPIELLLDGVKPIPQAEDPALQQRVSAAFAQIEQRYAPAVKQWVQRVDSKDTLFVKMPLRLIEKSDMTSNEAYITPEGRPELNVALNSRNLNLILAEADRQPTSYIRYGVHDIGMNFKKDPCAGKDEGTKFGYVALLPRTALQADGSIVHADGNLDVRIDRSLFRHKRDRQGRSWVCLGTEI